MIPLGLELDLAAHQGMVCIAVCAVVRACVENVLNGGARASVWSMGVSKRPCPGACPCGMCIAQAVSGRCHSSLRATNRDRNPLWR